MCPDCQNTGKVTVLSQDPATGEWTHSIVVRCECGAGDASPDDTDLFVEPVLGGEG